MQAAQRLEPDQQSVKVLLSEATVQQPELVLIDPRAAWRKAKLRTLVKIHKLFCENGYEMAEITINGFRERVNRRIDIFPERLHPVVPGEVYVARVNLRAERTRDIEIEF